MRYKESPQTGRTLSSRIGSSSQPVQKPPRDGVLPSILSKLTGLFTNKKKVKKMSFTTEPAYVGCDTHAQLYSGILSSDSINHRDVCNLAKAVFNVSIDSNQFCFRSGGPYGLVLKIDSVHTRVDTSGRLEDIVLTLRDCTMDTSMCVQISVKDIPEMLRPFKLQFTERTS